MYSKIKKTASTSCEAALEYLIREDFAPHQANSMLFADGSRIGLRVNKKENDPSFGTTKFSRNYPSLKDIREQITPLRFDSSLKISSIRNPYDRLISHFHFFKGNNNPLREFVELKQAGRIDHIRRRFEEYLECGPSRYSARQHWYIGPDMLIDKFIRMEYLCEDLRDTLISLKVPPEICKRILSRIPRFKYSGRSDTCLNITDYFTDKTLKEVNNRYSHWFALGGYLKSDDVASLEP